MSVSAIPIQGGAEQAFWAQVPADMINGQALVQVTNASHPDWSYAPDVNTPILIRDASSVDGESGLQIIAMDPSGMMVDIFVLYTSTNGYPQPAQTAIQEPAAYTADVTVIWRDEAGHPLNTLTETLNAGESRTYTADGYDGYVLISGNPSVTVTANADGTVYPAGVIEFIYAIPAPATSDVTLVWQDEAGNPFNVMSDTLTAGESRSYEAGELPGYILISGNPVVTVTANSDGTVSPSSTIVFVFAPAAPTTADVTVIWRDEAGNPFNVVTDTVAAGESRMYSALEMPGYELVSGNPSVTVNVNADGSVYPSNLIEFVYAAAAQAQFITADVTVIWRDEAGNPFSMVTDTLAAGENRTYDAMDIPGYALISGNLSVTVPFTKFQISETSALEGLC